MRLSGLICVCLVTLAGCDSNPTQPTTCTFSLSSTSASMGASGGASSVTVTTGSTCAWTGVSNASWITATGGTSVTGPGAFAFTVAAAPDSTARTGTLTVAGQTVTVAQQGLACTFSLSPQGTTIAAGGGTASFSVSASAGCTWTATTTAAWLTITSGASGSGSGTVTFAAAANPSTAPRTASLTVADQTYAVTQAGLSSCTVTLQRDDETFGVAGGSGTFDVAAASSCSWTVASNAAWISITSPAGGLGTGNGRVSYTVAANSGASARTGTMTVGGQTFVVTQAGTTACEYVVAPTDVNACVTEGFSRTVSVTTATGCPWTSSSTVSWITIASGLSGTGPGSVTYSLGPNYDAARQGIVAVRWPTVTAGQNVRINQSGCGYGLSVNTVDIPASGGDFSFDVVSSPTNTSCCGALQDCCMWSAAASASWVTVLSSMPRFGDDRVSYRVAANGTGSARSTTIVVRDRTLLIRQAG
jgi:hypothetical protein